MSTAISFTNLREYVQLMTGTPRRFSREQALLAYGREWTPTDKAPAWLVRGPKSNCFANAKAYALTRDDVRYVEGYAMDSQLEIPMEHAWLVDEHGEVIDPTWDDPDQSSYFGIAFKKSFIVEGAGANNGEPLLHPVAMRKSYASTDDFQAVVETAFGMP